MREHNYQLVMDTYKFGDIQFQAEKSMATMSIRVVALEPVSNCLAEKHIDTDVFENDPKIMRRVQRHLVDQLIKDPRSRKNLYRAMFDEVSNGYTFTHMGVVYGPYYSNEDAFTAYILLMESEHA